MAIRPLPSFSDILISEESFDLFLHSLTTAPETAASLTTTHQESRSNSFPNHGRGGRGSRGGGSRGGYNSGGRGRGSSNGNKRPPHC